MKVQLINVAEYEIKDGKTTEIPFTTFVNLCGSVGSDTDTVLPRVRLFKSIEEFKNLSNDELESLEQEENVKVLSNGQFLVFLKGRNKEKNIKAVKSNATTNTKEDKGE